MARRKETSSLDNILGLVAMLLWWVELALAAVNYVVLHQRSKPVPVVGPHPDQITSLMLSSAITALAFAG